MNDTLTQRNALTAVEIVQHAAYAYTNRAQHARRPSVAASIVRLAALSHAKEHCRQCILRLKLAMLGSCQTLWVAGELIEGGAFA